MKKWLLALFLLFPAFAQAQTVRADRFTLSTGPCTMRSGSGAPSGGLGVLCDTYLDTSTGILWLKQLSGWVVSGVSGVGTTDTVAKWTGSTAIGNSTITDVAGGNTTFASAGDLIIDPTGNDVLPTTGYDINLGMLTRKYLSLHAAELWVETLVAQSTMATIGGRIIVAPTNILVADLGSGVTSMIVKYNDIAIGDTVLLEADGFVEFMAITAGPSSDGFGHYIYSLTRNLDSSGANNWPAGSAVLNTGSTGNGFLDLYSVRGLKRSSYVDGSPLTGTTEIGPTIVGNVRTSSTFNAWSPRWAIGNLNGLYGYSGSTYGAAFGVPTGARVTIDGTNGIVIYGGDNDPKVTIDTSGNATFDGNLTVGTGLNQIRNSECRVSTDDWAIFENHGLSVALTFAVPSFRLNDESNTCAAIVTGTPANATMTNMYNTKYMPVSVGVHYEASAYIGLHRATSAAVSILWYDSGGSFISGSLGTSCTTALAGGLTLANFCRSYVIAAAPAGATTARMQVGTTHNGSGLDPYTFVVRTYFGEATLTQEDPTPWGAAGLTTINNGLLETDSITTRTLAADSVTSAKIVAGTIVASDIAAGTITADRLNVTDLSAITANIGTITSGSISGVTASFGGAVTLDGSGVTFASGTGTANKIKWTGGTSIHDASGSSYLSSGDFFFTVGGGGQVNISGGKLNVEQNFEVQTGIRDRTMDGFGSGRFVCHDDDGDYYDDGSQCDGLGPVMMQMINELRAEVEALRSELALLTRRQD